MKRFSMSRDINGYNGFGLTFSDTGLQTVLASGTEQHITVPPTTDAFYPKILAVFSFEPGSKVWVANNTTATVPTASFTATTSELNPAARYVNNGDVLSFITNNTSAEIGVSFYATT